MAVEAARQAEEPLLLADRDGSVLRLTMNRPASRNALSMPMMGALIEALDTAAADRETRVVVIAANGPGFCAGHDLRELRSEGQSDRRREALHAIFARCSELMIKLVRLPKPVIAEVHGIATAAGCQLVASCDLAVAGDDARFATPGVNIGLFCSTPMVALSRNVGRKAAMEMLLTGELISAQDAARIGLVNHVVAPGHERDEAIKLAQKITAKSAVTVKIGKEGFYRQLEMPIAEAYDYVSGVMVENLLVRDAEEGIAAFIEKREPKWEDR